jgi:hypothetical protein
MDGKERTLTCAGAAILTLGTALAWQLPWREYPGQDNIEIPSDYQEKTEWVFARLMYPPFMGSMNVRGFRGGFRGGDWKHGRSSWTTDYTSADRHVAVAIRWLTRVHPGGIFEARLRFPWRNRQASPPAAWGWCASAYPHLS